MKIRRHCYDKMWRCPGWAGGGWRYSRDRVCEGGSLDINWKLPPWVINLQFHRHECGVVAIPHITRWLDPTYLWWKIKWKFRR